MDDQIHFRTPTSSDARAMRSLARDTEVLSVNSAYYYALMARHFGTSCLVAEDQGQLCAYVIAYPPPAQDDTLFVWQVGVARHCQGKGLAKKLLSALITRQKPVFVEATIAPDNQASINLFKSVARHFGTGHIFSASPFFTEEELAVGENAEHLMQIGPFAWQPTK